MESDGHIAKEQTRGEEARSVLPEEFIPIWSGTVTPPTLILPL